MDTLHEGGSGVGNDDCGDHDLKQPSDIEKQHNIAVTGVDTLHELGSALCVVTLQVKEENLGRSSYLRSEDAGSSGADDENIAAGDCGINFDGFESTISNPLQKCPVFRDEFELGRNSPRHTASSGKLVSAMKGSREKEGMTLGKMRVSWAPDVYDPPPSSVSHNPKKKAPTRHQMKSSKKHGKGKHKGRSTLGGGSGPKDKKHYRKVGGRSDTDRVISSNCHKSSSELLDLDTDDKDLQTPDSSCKVSYLGKNRGSMHFAYASAT